MLDPKMSTYPPANKAALWIILPIALAGVLGVGITGWVIYGAICGKEKIWLYAVVGGWTIIPPIWFWLEYYLVYRRWGLPGTFDFFKYGQQVGGAIWAGVLAALLSFTLSDIVDPTQKVMSDESYEKICGRPQSDFDK